MVDSTKAASIKPTARIGLMGVGVALLILWVQRRGLGDFFASDDLMHLEQAFGLVPTPHTPWRILTQVAYFRLMAGVFGPTPLPFMAANLGLHLLNCWLVFHLLLSLGASRRVAGLAGILFGAHPLFVSVLGHAVGINEVIAAGFTLGSLLALERGGRHAKFGAPAIFTLAILSKESVLFMSLLAPAVGGRGMPLRTGLRRAAPMLGVTALFGFIFAALRGAGIGPGGVPYSVALGGNVFHDLMTYTAWSADLQHPIPDLVRSFSTSAWHVGFPIAIGLGVAALVCRSSRRLVVIGLGWWVVGLIPVLPLLYSTYGHYSYVPMIGMAAAVAAVLDCLASTLLGRMTAGKTPTTVPEVGAENVGRPRFDRNRVVSITLAVLAIAYAFRADALIGARYDQLVRGVNLPLDPTLRSEYVARRAVLSIGRFLRPTDDTIAVLVPNGVARTFGARTGKEYSGPAREASAYDLLETVLHGGRALRLFYPSIDSIAFIQEWTPAYARDVLFMEGRGGTLIGFGIGPDAHAAVAQWMMENGWNGPASEHLSRVLAAYPDDRRLRLLCGRALLAVGDAQQAARDLRKVVDENPTDSLAARANALLGVLPPESARRGAAMKRMH